MIALAFASPGLLWVAVLAVTLQPQPAADAGVVEAGRAGYVVQVPLPLVGDRDVQVADQIRRLSEASRQGSVDRPIVVLQFQSALPQGQGPNRNDLGTRGSQFERCLALARRLTDRESANLRLIAYLSETIEGHAVLPVLACQEVYARQGVELGRAAIDTDADATILAAYADIISRGRTNIPMAAVQAMLAPNIELRRLELAGAGGTRVATFAEEQRLKESGQVAESREVVWNGHGLAAFTSQQMRQWQWISPVVQDAVELARVLGVEGTLRSVRQIPRQWQAASLKIAEKLDRHQVNQIVRGIEELARQERLNLLVIALEPCVCQFDDAARLANGLAELRGKVYTASFVQGVVLGPVGLVAAACDEAVLIGDARLGADQNQAYRVAEGNAQQRVIEYIAETAERPLPLLAALVDPNVEVRLYKNSSGRREIFTDSQVAKQVDRDAWVPNQLLAGGGAIQPQVSLQYGLVNSIEKSLEAGLARLGLTELPEKLPAPWLDSSIQRLLAQGWLTRLLLMVGMMALLIELGNPGIGLGALVSGLCFLGFFWIEGFNGNVEWLEILLFFGGLFALGVELFALPGFGVFGVTGLMMIFVSLVLAGQTFVWPKDSAELSVVASNLFWVALMGFGAMVGLLVMHKRIERLPMFRWLSLQPGGTDEIEDLMQREAVVNYDHLFGQVGLTRTRLNPSGKAQFGHDLVSVVGSGNMIDAGIAVQVVEVRGNLVIVEEC